MIKRAWMRELEIILTSEKLKKKMIFGDRWKNGGNDLSIRVTGTKKLSSMQDMFTIKIENLTYSEIVQLIDGQYYDVEIKCGYRNLGKNEVFTIFKGGVTYISNELGDRKTNSVRIFCSNNLVAKFSQSRINLTLNSGINMFSALDFISKRSGMSNFSIDESLKNRIINDTTTINTNFSTFIENFTKNNNLVINGDSSYNSDYNVWTPRVNKRTIVLTDSTVILTGGYPTLTSEGVKIMLMPTFNFMPGDIIKIDNSILDIGITSASEITENVGYYLDKEGKYVITQIGYNLANRSDSFEMSIIAKSYAYYSQSISIIRGE